MRIDIDPLPAGLEPTLIGRMIELSGAVPTDQVTIVSRDVELLIELLHYGIGQAANVLPNCARTVEATDILFIPNMPSPAALATLLELAVPRLRPGGRVVLHGIDAGWKWRQQNRRLLDDAGLTVIGEAIGGQGTLLLACRLPAVHALRSAA